MKLKKSFFNKTIFWKNVTLYWPIWVLYTALLVFFQPIMLWISCYNSQYYDAYTYSDRLGDLIGRIYMDIHVYFIAIVAVFIGMALFHYLYNHKSANMIHALPVDRSQLFGTNVISGILFLAVPQTISSILLVIVALCNGIMEVHYVLYWLLLAYAIDIVAMSVVTFCAMLTGHILALPVYAFIVNYFSYWVYYIVYIMVEMFAFGASGMSGTAQKLTALFSPADGMSRNVGICMDYNAQNECVGALVYGMEVLVVYLLVAVVLYVVAYVLYQKRHVEQAGEFITVSWVKPIFRFGAAATGGFYGGMMIRVLLETVGMGCSMPMFVLLVLLIGSLAYFVAEMFIYKSFRIFKKKNWKGCAICSVLLLGTFVGLYGLAKQYEKVQPDFAEIEKATIQMGYPIEFEGEDIAKVLELQDAILANKEICIAAKEPLYGQYEYVNITYYLKNGDVISRGYPVAIGYEETEAILDEIALMEQDVDNYLSYIFEKDYKQISLFNGGWFEAQFYHEGLAEREGFEDYTYNSINFTSEQAEELFEAVVADAHAGTLMKYNVNTQWFYGNQEANTWEYSEAALLLEYYNPTETYVDKLWIQENSFTYPGSSNMQYVDVVAWSNAHLNFGPDCENIVNKLIEFGFIESVDDIYWGEIEE